MRFLSLIAGGFASLSLAYAQTPAVNPGGVVNTGSYAAEGVAPGSIVSIFGTNLAGSLAVASTIPLSTTLGDVTSVLGDVTSVTFNNIPAPLYFVGPLQINAQLPWDVLPSGTNSGTVNVVVKRSKNGASAPQSVNVVPSMPGIFTVSQNGLGQAIATDNNDGAISAATGSIAGVTTHPISLSSGHALIIWCTGVGPVTPSIENGAAAGSELRNTVAQPKVLIGGVEAQFVYSVLSPQYVSENQIGVVPAANTPTGAAVSLQIQVNGVTTSDKVTIAVTN